MRSRTILTAAIMTGLTLSASGEMQIALFDELTPLFPDTPASAGAAQHRSDTPRGVPVGVHALVRGVEPNAPLSWSLRCADGTPVVGARAYQLIDVPVEQNVGLTGWTEALLDKPNPHVIRDAPFRVYEALRPIDATARADSAGVAALRIEVAVAPDAEPGEREYELHLSSGAATAQAAWGVRVWPAVVPPPGPHSPGYTNWYSLEHLEDRHDVQRWSEPFWDMLRRYADLMRRGRQNTFLLPWRALLTRNDDGVALDHELLRRYVQLFLDRGFCRIEGGHLAGRHGGQWEATRLDVLVTGADVVSDAGRRDVAQIVRRMRDGLAALDLPPTVGYLQHLSDEPIDAHATAYCDLAAQVRAAWPGVQIFDAAMSQQVAGCLDVWCVQTHHFQEHRAAIEQRRLLGERVWIYTCLSPGGPWLNRLLDQERVRCVYLHWSLVARDLDGFLHWGLNFFRRGVDPYAQSVVPHGGEKSFLPAGDPHVFYPTPEGPIAGQRFEAHRLGAEDAELLRMLQARDGDGSAGFIIRRVFRSYDDWTPGVDRYRAARRALLEALAEPAEDEPNAPQSQ